MRLSRLRFARCAALAALAVSGLMAGCGSRTSSTHAPASAPASPTEQQAAADASRRLAAALLPRLGGAGNVVFSPYSIEAALAMIDQGAAGQTAAQIDGVLGAPAPSALARSNAGLAATLAADVVPPPGVAAARTAQLNVANGLWLQSHLRVEQPFTTTLTRDFGTAPQTIDFAADPEAARQTINRWVADHTAHLIPNLFQSGQITVQTVLVLANAIHLRARWSQPFDPTSTEAKPFYPTTGPAVSTPFMALPSSAQTTFPYAKGPGYVAVALPYANSHLSLMAIMPTAGTLPTFERALTAARIESVASSLRPRLLELAMPKLSIRIQTSLNDALAALGMPAAFSGAADFSRISPGAPLTISAVQHAAVLKVDENGTVAAAATGVGVDSAAIARVRGGLSVTLDHPYLLFLRDDRSGAVLFAARVANPAG